MKHIQNVIILNYTVDKVRLNYTVDKVRLNYTVDKVPLNSELKSKITPHPIFASFPLLRVLVNLSNVLILFHVLILCDSVVKIKIRLNVNDNSTFN